MNDVGSERKEQQEALTTEEMLRLVAQKDKAGGMKQLKLSKNMRLGSNSALSTVSPLD